MNDPNHHAFEYNFPKGIKENNFAGVDKKRILDSELPALNKLRGDLLNNVK